MIPTPNTEVLKKLPLVVILGATATGKSKLAVSLAQKFKGEIISADSMQIYKGLDILTNKMTHEEMQGIPHHMMSILDSRQSYDITLFQKEALPIVHRVLAEGRIPIIVGGTNYYIESLLWHVLVLEGKQKQLDSACNEDKRISVESESETPKSLAQEVLSLFERKQGDIGDEDLNVYPSTVLHSALETCDRSRATTLHPHDRRKIIRSIQIYYQTGRKHSDIISEQRSLVTEGSQDHEVSHLGGPLRFQNSLCFWIQADKVLLQQRIDQRVDEMVRKGLRNELDVYIEDLQGVHGDFDFTRGLLQSIGFKEFNNYLRLSASERRTPVGDHCFEEGIGLLKIATRQYAKRQLQWIAHRFLHPKMRQVPTIFGLDGNLTDEMSWEANVTLPAIEILENYLNGNFGHPIFHEKLVPCVNHEKDNLIRYCEECGNRAFVGKIQWEAHLVGRRHRKMKQKKNRTGVSQP